MIALPKKWLQSLLDHALRLEDGVKDWDYNGTKNDKVVLAASALSGYARSAKYIVANNKSLESWDEFIKLIPLSVWKDDKKFKEFVIKYWHPPAKK